MRPSVTRSTFFLSLLILTSALAAEEDANSLLEKGYQELAKGSDSSTKNALGFFEIAAALDSDEAAHMAGLTYLEGETGAVDLQKAFDYFVQSAENGYSPSQNHLGSMYQRGYPNPATRFSNYRRAANWYRLAAEQGYGPAEYNLGNLYRVGRGGPKDIQESLIWFTRAANQNIPEARYYLGMAYLLGQGVFLDKRRAYELFCVASSQGLHKAREVIEINFGSVGSDCKYGNQNYNDQSQLLLVVDRQYQKPGSQVSKITPNLVVQNNTEDLIFTYAQLTVAADSGSLAAIREKFKLSPLLNDNQKHEALLLARKLLFSEQELVPNEI